MAVRMLDRRVVIGIKEESTAGTAVSLANADATFCPVGRASAVVQTEMQEVDLMKADLSEVGDLPGLIPVQFTHGFAIKGSGTADTAPGFGKIMKAAGFDEDITASTSVVYHPETPMTSEPMTVALYRGPDSGSDGVIIRGAGCRVQSLQIGFDAGQPVVGQATWLGAFVDITDGALLSGSDNSTTENVAKAMNATHGGTAFEAFASMSLNITNTLAVVHSQASGRTSGISHYGITGRSMELSVSPHMTLQGTKDWVGTLNAGTTAALAWTVGSGAGGSLAFAAPAAQLQSVGDSDREGFTEQPLTFRLKRSSGDDELTITHT